jgi:hypothetical protein
MTIQRKQQFSRRAIAISLIIFIICGVIAIAVSHAAIQPIGFEPEGGTLAGGATKVSNSAASGGEGVMFKGAASSTGLYLVASQADLDAIKPQLTSGQKAAYWSNIVGSYATKIKPEFTPDWSTNVTYSGSTFNPTVFRADDLDATSVNSEGAFILASSQNAYGCAVKWYFAGDQACGTQAISILTQWSQHFTNVTPLASGNLWDIRGNQIRLYASWSVPNFTKAASLLWNDSAFTPGMKTQFSNWLWNTWLMQHATLTEDVHAPGEVLGQNSWNGRDSAYQARIFSGLTMKAAGNPNGDLVIQDTIAKMQARLPEDLYMGTAPWHQVLGSPWPVEPFSYQGSYYASAQNVRSWWKIDTTLASPFTSNMIGITVETGRDIGHQQLGTASLAEAFTAMRNNGYGDWFASNKYGAVLLPLGEKEAQAYNEALDAYWA